MSVQQHIAKEVTRYIDLIRERGPLTLWEIAVIVETEAFRIKDRLQPLIDEGMLLPFEAEGRTFFRLPEQEEGSTNRHKSLLSNFSSLISRKHTFEPISERTAMKRAMVEHCNYKKLINEAYILTLAPERYTEKERIKTNLVVERDIKKLKTLDEKKLYLADFIYEKALGKKRSYFQKRDLLAAKPEALELSS